MRNNSNTAYLQQYKPRLFVKSQSLFFPFFSSCELRKRSEYFYVVACTSPPFCFSMTGCVVCSSMFEWVCVLVFPTSTKYDSIRWKGVMIYDRPFSKRRLQLWSRLRLACPRRLHLRVLCVNALGASDEKTEPKAESKAEAVVSKRAIEFPLPPSIITHWYNSTGQEEKPVLITSKRSTTEVNTTYYIKTVSKLKSRHWLSRSQYLL